MKSRLFEGLRVLRALLGKVLVLVGTLTASLVIAPTVHGEQVIDTVTVVGTRTERTLEEVAATITVKDREDIEREMVRDMADLIRFEPGVTVAGTGSRFGLTSFNIRGIGGNRVLTMIDGVRVPDEFSFGPFLSARRDFVDVDSLDQVEIARGPISTLYGSDALGGVVAMRTLGPEDFLGDRSMHLGAKLGYSSADSSLVSRLSVAGDFNDAASGLLHYTHRKGDETKNLGTTNTTGPDRQAPDPQNIDNDNIELKLRYELSDNQVLTASASRYDNTTETDILSDYGISSRGTTTLTRRSIDTRVRDSWQLDYAHNGLESLLVDALTATVYGQVSESDQGTFETQMSRGQPQTRERHSIFEQDIAGLTIQLDRQIDGHTLTYGVDYNTTKSVSTRDGVTFAADGTPNTRGFPTRDFPLTEISQIGLFLQDEIVLGKWTLTPGVRYDSFEADASADQLYLDGNPGTPLPEDYDDSEVTFKVGTVFTVSDNHRLFARLSEGFRAPPYDDVNVGFTNFAFGYKTISSPGLTSEYSRGLEFGWRYSSERARISVAVFDNEYDNFIESFALAPAFAAMGGIDPSDGLRTFQSINRDKVTIDGIELKGEVSFSDAVSMKLALAMADGTDVETGQPLNSIEPLTGVLGFAFKPSDRFGFELIATGVEGKDEADIDDSDPRFSTAGYVIVDLLAHYQVAPSVRLNAGVFNVTDRTYIQWSDTAGIGGDDVNRFTQPGTNASITLRWAL